MKICKKVPQKQPETEVKKASVSGFWQQEQICILKEKSKTQQDLGPACFFGLRLQYAYILLFMQHWLLDAFYRGTYRG